MMKKRTISLNKKLLLKKSAVTSLDNKDQKMLLGGALSDATTPCGVCVKTQTPACNTGPAPLTQPVNMCNFALSKIPGDCHATGNVACQSIKNGNCGTVISNAGGGCWG